METFEKYYDDIIKTAIEHWENEKNDTFNGLENDPIVKLLLSAIAFQSYNIEKDIKNYLVDTTKQFRDKIIPYHLIMPIPSFSIVETNFIKEYPESSMIIDEYHVFEFTKNKRKIKFSPLLKTKVINAKIKSCTATDFNTYNIILESKDVLTDIKYLSFYIDSNKPIDIDIKYNNMSLALIKPNDYNKLPFIEWFDNKKFPLKDHQFLFGNYEYWQNIFVNNNSNLFYIDDYDIKNIILPDNNIIELCLKIKSPNTEINLEKDNIKINCIPVINVEKKEIELSDKEPIKALSTEQDIFLNLIYNSNIKDIEKYTNSFIIRNYGVERYNQTQAISQLKDICQRYISDYYAFKSINGLKNSDKLDKIRTTLEEVFHIVNENKDLESSNNYAVFKLNNDLTIKNENIFIEYLSTSGEFGNGIKKDEKALSTPKFLDKMQTKLILDTKGGKNLVENEEEKNRIAKYYFLTKEKIVTQADIISFCYKELGDNIKKIEVNKDYDKIKVDILLTDSYEIKSQNDADQISNSLQKKIEVYSTILIPIVVSTYKNN